MDYLINFVDAGLNSDMGRGLILFGSISAIAVFAHNSLKFLLNFVVSQVTTSIYISGTDENYNFIKLLLNKTDSVRKKRRFTVSSMTVEQRGSNEEEITVFTLAEGSHFLVLNGVLAKITFQMEEAKNSQPIESLTLIMLTRDRRVIEHLLEKAQIEAVPEDCIKVSLYSGWWNTVAGVPSRSQVGFVSNHRLVDEVIEDCRVFLGRERYYWERGIPYRRGYLFSGPAGTGKTSLITVLASELSLPLYILPLGNLDSDIDLMEAIADVPGGSILVLEDIDSFGVVHNRDSKRPKEQSRLSLAALLNAIDGIGGGHRRILIATTNYPEKIDKALLRPGRIDRHVVISFLEYPAVSDYLKIFYQVDEIPAVSEYVSISGAELQRLCLENCIESVVQTLNVMAPSARHSAIRLGNTASGEAPKVRGKHNSHHVPYKCNTTNKQVGSCCTSSVQPSEPP